MTETSVIIQAMALTMFVKVLVDAMKISPIPSPAAVIPIVTLVLSLVLAVLYDVANSVSLTRQALAQSVFVAILAFGGAVGVTELQKRSNIAQTSKDAS
jgi:predicted neutral ceramidase superfamily lipid hydrolase